MNKFPIYLLPKGEIMMTATIENSKIKLLNKTIFPSNNRYCISETGLALCLDRDKKILIYGQLTLKGHFEYLKILPFSGMISPKSIQLVKNFIIFGGENKSWGESAESNKLIATYSLSEDKFCAVETPPSNYSIHYHNIDDLLLDEGSIVFAVDTISPRASPSIIEYDFSNPNYPFVKKISLLHIGGGPHLTIKKGTINNNYIAVLSHYGGVYGHGKSITIFLKHFPSEYLDLSQVFLDTDKNESETRWSDIFLIPNSDFLLIAAHEEGIGIYQINADKVTSEGIRDRDNIYYYNPWSFGKDLVKILQCPQDFNYLILVFSEEKEGVVLNSYEYVSISSITKNNTIGIDEYSTEFYARDNNGYEKLNNDEMFFDDIVDGQLGDCKNFDEVLDESNEKIKINMAYITNANFKKIITYKIDINSIKIEEEIYKIDIKWFNKYELKELLAFKKLFSDPEAFFKRYGRFKFVDTKTKVWENPPAFHSNLDCELMNSDYSNYSLPSKIKDSDEETIKKYRIWFKSWELTLHQNSKLFLQKQNEQFGTTESPIRSKYANSGTMMRDNWNQKDLEAAIGKLIEQTNDFIQRYLGSELTLKDFQYSYEYRKEVVEQKKKILQQFEEQFKEPMKELLKEYYRIVFNKDMSFDSTFLEGIGFIYCASCSGRYKIEDITHLF